MAKTNNKANVSVGKPKAGGAVFVAPAGTELPTDAKTALPDDFKCLGCISEDGVVQSQEIDSEDIPDWEGNIVDSPQTSFAETYQMTYIEHMNADVLGFVYGADNVVIPAEGDAAIKVMHSGDDRDEVVMVVDTVLKGKKLDRLVIPRAKCGEIGDVPRKRNELIAYEATVKALSDDAGKTTYEYIEAVA
ncbi:hypothetical protein [Gordonibacter massiliensis (ex Traore et al. 2017)]|uniref:phage tail tube protein n=1 Tax=Gordonibacter massiliensis (ex Traore et al. 2017) TaxID=1841863 RepID=UPI001C8BD21D|nr:hypothetical protein [Gordonibacter massiliensis (ex Traore et al. 2017)]MBX9035032.1 phage tail protein [Gordonibacter massiliensis (ex Traore et al. 2017)]